MDRKLTLIFGKSETTTDIITKILTLKEMKSHQRRWLSLSQVSHVGKLLPYMADSQKIRYLGTWHIKPNHLRSLNLYFDKF